MTTYSVTSGHTSTSLTLSNGDFLYVSSGGTATFTTVSDGGSAVVLSSGSTSFTTVSHGGVLLVSSGGTGVSTTVDSGGTEFVHSRGQARDTILDGGSQSVALDGTAISTTVNGRGVETTVGSGTAIGGGTVSFTTVNSGGAEEIGGGLAVSTTLNAGGSGFLFEGGTASFTAVNSGGVEYVKSGGTAVSTTLHRFGDQYVSGGGTASFTSVNGGLQLVYDTAISTTLSDNGAQAVESGGTAIGTTVDSGGNVDVAGNSMLPFPPIFSYLSRTTVNSGGTAAVGPDSVAVSTTVNSGGTEFVGSTGTATFTTVSDGGAEFVYSGGSAISTTVTSAGAEFAFSGATVSDATVSSGGYFIALPGATQTGTKLSGGAIVSTGVVLYGPNPGVTVLTSVVSDAAIGSGATEYILPSGTASFTTVTNGGREDVYLDGAASFTTVSSGGNEFVYSGGTARDTTLGDGAAQGVRGIAVSTTVSDGGQQFVLSGGTAISTTVDSGGTEILSGGSFGVASDTVMNLGGSIDVTYLSYTSGGSASVNTSSLLTVSVGGHSYSQQLSGDYADVRFQLTSDPYLPAGTLITAEAPCFRSLTRILTDRGEAAVETLRIGDLVQTVLGGTLTPIAWIGRREVDCARHPHPRKVWPVRVAAGAFGPDRPHSDLFLSPDHAVYVEGVLIPIRHLINGRSIVQVPTDRVTYYHLELPQHDVLLAQGLPAESFLDLRDGSNYANRAGPTRLYPDFSAGTWEAFGCAPLVVTGPELDAARALVARFAPARAAA